MQVLKNNYYSKENGGTMRIPMGLAAIFVIALILTGCTTWEKEPSEEELLKKVVTRYNYALIEAYKSQFYDRLKEVTGRDEFRRIRIIITSYLQASEVMEAELHTLEFGKIKIEEKKATVDTTERWSYRWIDYRTGREVEPLKEINYNMRYHLVRDEDRGWIVERVEDLQYTGNPLSSGAGQGGTILKAFFNIVLS